MKIIHNRLLPPRRYDAINILGIVFCRRGTTPGAALIRHERIHTRQMWEMLVVGFYVWYLAEWLVRLCMPGRAYSQLAMEREAYQHMHDPDYLRHRKPYAWVKYLRKHT